MRNFALKKKIIAAAVGGLFALGVAGPALAKVTEEGGGTWDRGENSSIVWSYYIHNANSHKTAVNNGKYHYSACEPGGIQARVSADSRWYAVDSAYWNWCS